MVHFANPHLFYSQALLYNFYFVVTSQPAKVDCQRMNLKIFCVWMKKYCRMSSGFRFPKVTFSGFRFPNVTFSGFRFPKVNFSGFRFPKRYSKFYPKNLSTNKWHKKYYSEFSSKYFLSEMYVTFSTSLYFINFLALHLPCSNIHCLTIK